MLKILYEDADYIAVDKPSGLLVHPTELTRERENCMAMLRDQIGRWVYPVHRLDRSTSGVLLFALSSDAARDLATAFSEKRMGKTYYAIVRGHAADSGEIDRPLREDKDHDYVPAFSKYERVASVELPYAVGRYATARYSMVKVQTLTGRLHQVRKHMASVSHPILGDTCYGEGKHNRLIREKFGVWRLLLEAKSVSFEHPYLKEQIRIESEWSLEFKALFREFQWSF